MFNSQIKDVSNIKHNDAWYSSEDISNLIHTVDTKTVKYVQDITYNNNWTFERIVTNLFYLRNPNLLGKLALDVSFIVINPVISNVDTRHFIFCKIIDSTLLVVNPTGGLNKDTAQLLAKLSSTFDVLGIKKILVSATKVQQADFEPGESISSCGPFSVEFMNNTNAITEDALNKLAKKQAKKNFSYEEVDLTLLLPEHLKPIDNKNIYQERVAQIRKNHAKILSNSLNKKNMGTDALMQVVMRWLGGEDNNKITIMNLWFRENEFKKHIGEIKKGLSKYAILAKVDDVGKSNDDFCVRKLNSKSSKVFVPQQHDLIFEVKRENLKMKQKEITDLKCAEESQAEITIVEILDHASYISYEMEEFIEKLQTEQLEQQYCMDVIDSIIDEIHNHSEKLYVYAGKFKYSVDYWMERDIQRTIDFLEKVRVEIVQQNTVNLDSSRILAMRSYLRRYRARCPGFFQTFFIDNANKKLDVKITNSVEFKMHGIFGLWDDKYILHLGDWRDNFNAYREMLNDAVCESLYNIFAFMEHNDWCSGILVNKKWYHELVYPKQKYLDEAAKQFEEKGLEVVNNNYATPKDYLYLQPLSKDDFCIIGCPPLDSGGDIYHILAYLMLAKENYNKLPVVLLTYDNDKNCKTAMSCERFAKLLGFKVLVQKICFTAGHYKVRLKQLRAFIQCTANEVGGDLFFIDQKATTEFIARYFVEYGVQHTSKILRRGFLQLNKSIYINNHILFLLKRWVAKLCATIKEKAAGKRIVLFQERISSGANKEQNFNMSGIISRLQKRDFFCWKLTTTTNWLCDPKTTSLFVGMEELKNIKVDLDSVGFYKLRHVMLLVQLLKLPNLVGVIANTSGLTDIISFLGHSVYNIHKFAVKKYDHLQHQELRILFQTLFMCVDSEDIKNLDHWIMNPKSKFYPKLSKKIHDNDAHFDNKPFTGCYLFRPQNVDGFFRHFNNYFLPRNNANLAEISFFATTKPRKLICDDEICVNERQSGSSLNNQ